MITSITFANLYQRQISLIGEQAQKKLIEAKVLVIGAGGLGCPALVYLASSGIGRIGIVDFDYVSASNLQRQIIFRTADIGKKKVDVAKDQIQLLAPYCQVSVVQEALTGVNAQSIIANYDIVLDCTDNFSSKFLIHDVCFKLNKFLVQASVYQYEGQIQVFDFNEGVGPCLRCLWPQQPQDGCVGTCAEVGVLGPLLGVLGSMQAMEALKILIGKKYLKNGQVLFADLIDQLFEIRKYPLATNCKCCVQGNFPSLEEDYQINLPTKLDQFVLLDVRTKEEHESCLFIKSLSKNQPIIHHPLSLLDSFKATPGNNYLSICASGARSLKACQILRKEGFSIYSLIGGVGHLGGLDNH